MGFNPFLTFLHHLAPSASSFSLFGKPFVQLSSAHAAPPMCYLWLRLCYFWLPVVISPFFYFSSFFSFSPLFLRLRLRLLRRLHFPPVFCVLFPASIFFFLSCSASGSRPASPAASPPPPAPLALAVLVMAAPALPPSPGGDRI